VCSNEYGANYRVADKKKRYCSDACKAQQRQIKAKKQKEALVARRLLKLPCNDFFLWLSRECKRSGSIEILQGHTVESLEQLHQLYLYKMRCFGYDPEKKTSRYHLCHIHAAVTDSRIGLLHPANLFVGDSLRNQALGNKTFPYVGMSISRNALKSEWLVDKADTDRKILDKVAKYLGRTLKEYAAQYPIDRSARFVLASWVMQHQAGHFDVPYSESELFHKSTDELRKLRAKIEQKEHFNIKLKPARSFKVYFDEVHRLSQPLPDSRHRDDLIWLTDVIRVGATFLRQLQDSADDDRLDGILTSLPGIYHKHFKLKEGKDLSKFRDWLSFVCFEALQGFPVNRDLVRNTLHGYLTLNLKTIDYSPLDADSWSATQYADEIAQHRAQVESLRDSALSLGLDCYVTFNAPKKPTARVVQHIPMQLPALPAEDSSFDYDDGWVPF